MDRLLTIGEHVPWLAFQPLGGGEFVNLARLGGAPILLAMLGSLHHPRIAPVVAALSSAAVSGAKTLIVTCQPDDFIPADRNDPEHLVFGLDRSGALSAAVGAIPEIGAMSSYRPHLLVLDRRLQVVAVMAPDEHQSALALIAELAAEQPDTPAPVLIMPRLFEPEFCDALIHLYETGGNEESGFMSQRDGRTQLIHDHGFKRRRDHLVTDERIRNAIRMRLRTRLIPAIRRAFQYEATRIERYLVAAYDAETGGYFKPHRDNTTSGTAHRKFAVTINLNDAFDGGELRFPEFGQRTYRAERGGAVVFSCSLLHEATAVTRGRRYACLPFLYDDASAEIRKANAGSIDLEPTGVSDSAVG